MLYLLEAFFGRDPRGMRSSERMELAKQTVEVLARGSYTSPEGHIVNIREAVAACRGDTRFFWPEELEGIQQEVLSRPSRGVLTAFEVVNETTLGGIARMLTSGHGPVAALNFASAKNPGGGFLNGSEAQEESLARSSALYASLVQARDFYQLHRKSRSLLYSDSMILSPGCPVIRDGQGVLLEEPHLVTFITSAAPNAGAIANNAPEELPAIPDVFRRRAAYVLALAASQGYRNLVLGAWGCGVFRNDPTLVAGVFSEHLRRGAWSNRFQRIIFSVLDTSPSQSTLAAFQSAFGT